MSLESDGETDELGWVTLMPMYTSNISWPFYHWGNYPWKSNRKLMEMNGVAVQYYYYYLSGNTTFTMHHTFETLSSNTPRANGKILCKTCRSDSIDPSQGSQIPTNVNMTTTPSFIKRFIPSTKCILQ